MTPTKEPWLEPVADAIATAWGECDDNNPWPATARAAYDALKRLGMIVPEGVSLTCDQCGCRFGDASDIPNVLKQLCHYRGSIESQKKYCPIRKGRDA